jgi:glycerol uptake operon antiterminator
MRKLLANSPLIPAVRREGDLPQALRSKASGLFLLCGDINTLAALVASVRAAGKQCFLHLDLVGGFGSDRAAMRFIARQIQPTGILTTKSHQIRNGKEEGLTCIQRLFIFDNQSLTTAVAQSKTTQPAAVEVMPGILPDWALQRLVREIKVPVIAGGLIQSEGDVSRILRTGVAGVSVGSPALW